MKSNSVLGKILHKKYIYKFSNLKILIYSLFLNIVLIQIIIIVFRIIKLINYNNNNRWNFKFQNWILIMKFKIKII